MTLIASHEIIENVKEGASPTISLLSDDDSTKDDDDDRASSNSEATFVHGYIFVVLIAVVLFCGCACLSANGWVHGPVHEESMQHSTRSSIVLLRDSTIEPGWICWICAFENKANSNLCALCGADIEVTQNYDQRTLLPSLHNREDTQEDNSIRANVQPVSLGGQTALDATARSQSFTIGRLNALTLRQKGAARRQLWRRAKMSSGAYHWIRTMSRESNESSSAYITTLQLNPSEDDNGKQEYDVNWSRIDETSQQPLLPLTSKYEEEKYMCCCCCQKVRTGNKQKTTDDLEHIAALPFREKQFWLYKYFRRQQQHQRGRIVSIEIRRSHIIDDSIRRLEAINPKRLAHSPLRIRFRDEVAVDAGGVAREWFQIIAKTLFEDLSLFVSKKEAGYAANINPFSGDIHSNHLRLFNFAGRFVAKALRDRVSLPITICLPLLKHILSVPLTFADLEFIDAESFQSYAWIRDYQESDDTNSTLEALGLTFCVDSIHPRNGSVHTADLVPNGRNIAVTEANKSQYLSLVLKYRVLDAVREQLISFLRGFDEIIDRSILSVFDYQELQLLIGGVADMDINDWKRHTRYLGAFAQLQDRHPVVQMFWHCIENDFDETDRARLCQFTTGSSQLPPMGFKALTGDDGRYCPFTLASLPRALGLWPRAHTCFNRLDLPLYKSYDELHSYLSLTIRLEVVGFTME
eukprot:CAMPEP_0197314796 /NCGR_PEP_ID=MMETSP0891-20130614/35278_1 /TAXON_ID=44058 ORGANISM="Aureoumbra lagunensis, Strain CCMP1510" /NCGR_SAMPLE_ID=MMETSP0891 /ASSEMBLY_ACC=CAM_ASM_000534 /LENGTH=693 /DNA_ID=CAMNT_0042803413 /DNA_START=42 /DNA_END=2123 /DNA_ORIENTATION=+